MKQLLERPVEYGELRLAPTTELAGLAELAELSDHEERLAAMVRIADAVRAEDEARRHITEGRCATEPAPLPHRR